MNWNDGFLNVCRLPLVITCPMPRPAMNMTSVADDRLHPKTGDEPAVEQPEQARRGDRERRRRRRLPMSGMGAPERAEKDQRRERARDRHQRTDGQVDAAGGDDQRHADRHDDDRRHLGQVDVQRLPGGEMRRHGEIEREQRQDGRRAPRSVVRRRRDVRQRPPSRQSLARQPCSLPSAEIGPTSCAIAAMIAGAVALACGRSATVRPSLKHEDPIGAFDDLLELRGNHQHAETLVGELAGSAT